MEEANKRVFAWKQFVFTVHVDTTKIQLRWRQLKDHGTKTGLEQNGAQPGQQDEDSLLEIPGPSNASPNAIRPAHICESSVDIDLDLDGFESVSIVTTRFSYSSKSLQRVPVIVLECRSKAKGRSKSSSEHGMGQSLRSGQQLVPLNLIIFEVREKSSDNHLKKVHYHEKTGTNMSQFILTQRIAFPLVIKSDSVATISENKIRVLADFQLLVLMSEDEHIIAKLCSPAMNQSRVQDFVLPYDNNNVSDIHFLDVYDIQESGTFLALLLSKDKEGNNTCINLKFSSLLSISNSTKHILSHEMDILPLDVFFTPEYAALVKSVSISSLTFNPVSQDRSTSYSTTVVLETETAYVLLFRDGVLTCTVNLTGQLCNIPDYMPADKVGFWCTKLISLKGYINKTAVQAGHLCLLVDWAKGKAVWHSTSILITCDIQSSGMDSLVILSYPENSGLLLLETLHLEEAVIEVIDPDDEFHNGEGGETNDAEYCMLTMLGSDRKVKAEFEDTEIKDRPVCAMNALIAQQKLSRSAYLESESELKDKVSFMTEVWQQLSQLQINRISKKSAPGLRNREPSLLTLVEGSLPDLECSAGHYDNAILSQPAAKIIKTSNLWKRTIDCEIVVGLTVTNVFCQALTDVSLTLIPTSSCYSTFCTTNSRSRHGLPKALINSNDPERNFTSHGNRTDLDFGSSSDLPPGASKTLTCVADLSSICGDDDTTLQVFVKYSVSARPSRTAASAREEIITKCEVEEYCAEIHLSSQELVKETFSIANHFEADGSTQEPAVTSEDLCALDCVQFSFSLTICSVVTSLSCLSAKLSAHPSLTFVNWASQFIVLASQQLRFSRLQILGQTSRHKGNIRIYVRSHQQCLLFVQFLYTFLPDDMTVHPPVSSSSHTHKLIGEKILTEVDKDIESIRYQISASANTTVSVATTNSDMQEAGPSSPTFPRAQGLKMKSKISMRKNINVQNKQDPGQVAVDRVGGKVTQKDKTGSVQEIEVEQIKRTRKRPREQDADRYSVS